MEIFPRSVKTGPEQESQNTKWLSLVKRYAWSANHRGEFFLGEGTHVSGRVLITGCLHFESHLHNW